MKSRLQLCIAMQTLAFPIKVEQYKTKAALFRVTYGLEVRDRLTYAEAAQEFGHCVFHALECADRLKAHP